MTAFGSPPRSASLARIGGESCFSATAWDARSTLLVVGGSRMSQQSRRHDPYPWTWEIPLGIVLVILMVLVCGVHLGRGIANVLGRGWLGVPETC